MPRIRTTMITVATIGVVGASGIAVTSAYATPAPVAAVEAAVPAEPTVDDGTKAGGGRHPVRHWWKGLTDAQRTCLEDADIERPVGRLDDTERAALRASIEKAADTCAVELPFGEARAWWDGLTDAQESCLRDAALTRSWGPLTKDERQDLRADVIAAAEKCDVQLPTGTAAGQAN
ncbi:MAG: hypothetical protein ACRCZP_16650 [Phycicoccus sp.]